MYLIDGEDIINPQYPDFHYFKAVPQVRLRNLMLDISVLDPLQYKFVRSDRRGILLRDTTCICHNVRVCSQNMDHENDKLLRIGTFSTLSRISVRMLRHYQERGVLAPAWIDPFNGHRYYQPEQLATANLAVQLRDAGFSVEKIAQLLTVNDPARVEAAIDVHRRKLSRQREDLHAQFAALDRVSTTLKGRPEMTEVNQKTMPEMIIASLRGVVPTYYDEKDLWERMVPLLQQSGVSFPAGGLAGATYHDADYKENDVDIEVWMQVTESFTPVPPLQCRVEPAREIVTATLRGDYSQMPSVTGVLGAYIAEHRLATGLMFNIYRVSPAQNPDPSSWITDVCFPVLGK